jgi:hypothetical protein
MSDSDSPPHSNANDSVALTTERIKELIPIYERERDRHPKNSFPHKALQYQIDDLKARLKKAEAERQATESNAMNASLGSTEEEDKKR